MEFPEPVISVAVEPKTKVDQEKMGVALQKLAKEDPSFRVHTDEESGQTIISGMGELHLDIIVDRMKREFKVEAQRRQARRLPTARRFAQLSSRNPSSFASPAVVDSTAMSTCVSSLWRPVPDTNSLTRLSAVLFRASTFPQSTRVSGIRWKMVSSPVIPSSTAGSRSTTVRTTTSTRARWLSRLPDRWVSGTGALKADPVLLEPIMKVEVVTPEDYMGDVMGDLNRRRGLPQGMDESPSGKVIKAEVPLAEMFGYATDLRSMSQGRAVYSMEFEKYAEVPQNVADTVLKKAS